MYCKKYLIGLLYTILPLVMFAFNSNVEQLTSSSIDLMTGDVKLPINLIDLGGRNGLDISINAIYDSNIQNEVNTWNQDAPTDILGLGWSIDCIEQILVNNKNSFTKYDDEYSFISGGGIKRLIRIISEDDSYELYQVSSNQNQYAKYYPDQEKWELFYENGVKKIFGDPGVSSASDYNIHNTVGFSVLSHIYESRQMVSVWNLSKIVHFAEDEIVYEYETTMDSVVCHQNFVNYTKDSRINKITDVYGRTVNFSYVDKDSVEYSDPHQEETEPDKYQEYFSTKYLKYITVKEKNDNLLYQLEFLYDNDCKTQNDDDFLPLTGSSGDLTYDDTSLTKRYLKTINYTNRNSKLRKFLIFDYYLEQTDLHFGAIKNVSSEIGEKVVYNYSAIEIDNIKRMISIEIDSLYDASYTWYGKNYIVVGKQYFDAASNQLTMKFDLYTWNGKWEVEEDIYDMPFKMKKWTDSAQFIVHDEYLMGEELPGPTNEDLIDIYENGFDNHYSFSYDIDRYITLGHNEYTYLLKPDLEVFTLDDYFVIYEGFFTSAQYYNYQDIAVFHRDDFNVKNSWSKTLITKNFRSPGISLGQDYYILYDKAYDISYLYQWDSLQKEWIEYELHNDNTVSPPNDITFNVESNFENCFIITRFPENDPPIIEVYYKNPYNQFFNTIENGYEDYSNEYGKYFNVDKIIWADYTESSNFNNIYVSCNSELVFINYSDKEGGESHYKPTQYVYSIGEENGKVHLTEIAELSVDHLDGISLFGDNVQCRYYYTENFIACHIFNTYPSESYDYTTNIIKLYYNDGDAETIDLGNGSDSVKKVMGIGDDVVVVRSRHFSNPHFDEGNIQAQYYYQIYRDGSIIVDNGAYCYSMNSSNEDMYNTVNNAVLGSGFYNGGGVGIGISYQKGNNYYCFGDEESDSLFFNFTEAFSGDNFIIFKEYLSSDDLYYSPLKNGGVRDLIKLTPEEIAENDTVYIHKVYQNMAVFRNREKADDTSLYNIIMLGDECDDELQYRSDRVLDSLYTDYVVDSLTMVSHEDITTTYQYDTATAVQDYSGSTANYNLVTVQNYNGGYGYSQFHFVNGSTSLDGIAVLTDSTYSDYLEYPDLYQGFLYHQKNFNITDECVSENKNFQSISSIILNSELSATINAALPTSIELSTDFCLFPQVTKSISALSGITEEIYSYYNDKGFISRDEKRYANGETLTVDYKYIYDAYDEINLPENLLNMAVQINSAQNDSLKSALVTTWKNWSTDSSKKWAENDTYSLAKTENVSGDFIDWSIDDDHLGNPNLGFIADWTRTKNIRKRDDKGNVLETCNNTGVFNTVIYEEDYNLPLATFSDAKNDQIFYTSFEYVNVSADVVDNISCRTGVQAKKVQKGFFSVIGEASLNGETEYKVTYWLKKGTAPQYLETILKISGVGSTIYEGSTTTTTNEWEKQEGTFYLTNNEVIQITCRIDGETATEIYNYIDEISIVPVNSTITTTAYHPLYLYPLSVTDFIGMSVFSEYNDDDEVMVTHSSDNETLTLNMGLIPSLYNDGDYNENNPNTIISVSTAYNGYFTTFSDNTLDQWNCDPSWEVNNGNLLGNSSSSESFAELTGFNLLSEVAIRTNISNSGSIRSYGLKTGNILVKLNEDQNQFELYVADILIDTKPIVAEYENNDWLLLKQRDHIYLWVNGYLVFDEEITGLIIDNLSYYVSSGDGTVIFDNLSIINHPKANVTYAYGNGDPIYSIVINQTASGKNMISPVIYDENRLVTEQYLSYPSENLSIAYKDISEILEQQADYYTDNFTDSHPYSESVLENSPLMRVIEKTVPGDNFSRDSLHTTKIEYYTNSGTSETYIRKWRWTPLAELPETLRDDGIIERGGTYLGTGVYEPSSLYITKTTDPDGKEIIVYKDKLSRTIFKISMLGMQEVGTYYLYDDSGKLQYLVPPEALKIMIDTDNWIITSELLENWITEYCYENGRLISKTTPEKGKTTTVYDRLGRNVLSQNEKQRLDDTWSFIKYDRYGREIISGKYHAPAGTDRESLQLILNSPTYMLYEENSSENYAKFHGYSDNAFPHITNCDVFTVTYYDDYDFDRNGSNDLPYVNDSEYSLNKHIENPLGKLTGYKRLIDDAKVYPAGTYDTPFGEEKVVVCGDEICLAPGFNTITGQRFQAGNTTTANFNWQKSAIYYNHKYHTIQSIFENHLGGRDVVNSYFDTSGHTTRSKLTHETNLDSVEVRKRFSYDYFGRLVNEYQRMDDKEEYIVANYSYNELGLTTEKNIHTLSDYMDEAIILEYDRSGNYLQSLDYSYNMQGQITALNNRDLSGDDNDLFGMEFYYDQPPSFMSGTPLYNGYISGVTWKTATSSTLGNEVQMGYKYDYDSVGRLKNADFLYRTGNDDTSWLNNGKYSVSGLTYDLNGNIQTAIRKDATGLVDELSYFYDNNKLFAVDDAIATTSGEDFKDNGYISNGSVEEYLYDESGNMIYDENKQMEIRYNDFNLPYLFDFGNDNLIRRTYTSDGTKVKETIYTDGVVSKETHYINGFLYNITSSGAGENKELTYRHSSGKCRKKNLATDDFIWDYEYDIKDHVGNIRVTFKDDGSGVAEIIQDSHYYPFGMKLPGLCNTTVENEYTYQGQEYQGAHYLNWLDFGYRNYDPQLGRWHSFDPKDQFHSPYVYNGNNPINFVDPDGTTSAMSGHIQRRLFKQYKVRRAYTEYFEKKLWNLAASGARLYHYENLSWQEVRKSKNMYNDVFYWLKNYSQPIIGKGHFPAFHIRTSVAWVNAVNVIGGMVRYTGDFNGYATERDFEQMVSIVNDFNSNVVAMLNARAEGSHQERVMPFIGPPVLNNDSSKLYAQTGIELLPLMMGQAAATDLTFGGMQTQTTMTDALNFWELQKADALYGALETENEEWLTYEELYGSPWADPVDNETNDSSNSQEKIIPADTGSPGPDFDDEEKKPDDNGRNNLRGDNAREKTKNGKFKKWNTDLPGGRKAATRMFRTEAKKIVNRQLKRIDRNILQLLDKNENRIMQLRYGPNGKTNIEIFRNGNIFEDIHFIP
ncbi:MAG: RHS repeat-associated core domain-containing protein [Candidatus Cloacimonetes bacterium]|nr:RHS repeat-associated core domain-containing protein [Candidatus Cloacimonadota bacterium]